MIVAEGDEIIVDNYTIVLDMVMDDSVYVISNGEAKKIKEGSSARIGGVEVYVSEVLYTEKSTRVSKAILSIGDDVEETVSDEEEYGESIFEWIIGNRTIGVVLAEEFKDLDENNMPLAIGDVICLPNDYICVKLDEMSDEDYSEYTFEYDNDSSELKISGDFEVGFDDVDELIVNTSGIYYENEEGNMQNANEAILKDSDATFNYNTTTYTISIEDVVVALNVSYVNFGFDDESNEGSYRSIYGSIVELDNDLEIGEDNEVSISVPEEQVELSFRFY